MIIKAYDSLPIEAVTVRTTVFVEEQGFCNELDDIDNIATHLVMFDENKTVATCRYYYDSEKNTYLIGRLAVMKAYRGQKLGAKLLLDAEQRLKSQGERSVTLHSQLQAKRFYEKQGYSSCSDVDYDEDCPHIWMTKNL
ncbi:MAG: GNAT family N-acetyltransferase [Clostridiales bacterium]|nr:GNAT family N-acetyltransferase [Clostridiales bacterium]